MNKKGFVFAETIVVISVVAVALISLYTVFYTVYNEENKRINYDNSQDLYALYYVRNFLNENKLIDNCAFSLKNIKEEIYYKEITDDENDDYDCAITDNDEVKTYFKKKMKPTFEIESLYLIKGDKVSALKDSNTKNMLDGEIIDYLKTMKNLNNDNEYYLLGEFKTKLPIESQTENLYRIASIKIIKG